MTKKSNVMITSDTDWCALARRVRRTEVTLDSGSYLSYSTCDSGTVALDRIHVPCAHVLSPEVLQTEDDLMFVREVTRDPRRTRLVYAHGGSYWYLDHISVHRLSDAVRALVTLERGNLQHARAWALERLEKCIPSNHKWRYDCELQNVVKRCGGDWSAWSIIDKMRRK